MAQSVAPGGIQTQPNAKIVPNAPYDDKHTYYIKVINSSARRNKMTKRKATGGPSHAMLTRSRAAHQQQARRSQRSSSATSSSSSRSLKPATSRKGTPVKKSRGLGATAKRRVTRVAEEEEREERRRTMMKMESVAPLVRLAATETLTMNSLLTRYSLLIKNAHLSICCFLIFLTGYPDVFIIISFST